MITRAINCSLILVAVLLCNSSFAQSQGTIYLPYNDYKVYAYGTEQTIAWAGGFSNPQFAMADLNNDGRTDLVVYEASNARLRTFISSGTPGNPVYSYAPAFESNFPEIVGYIKLVDYNGDNIPDLFHRGMSGIAAYKGSYNTHGELTFTLYKEIYYNSPVTGQTNAYVEPGDIPAILDVDGDGDVDFLSFYIGGGQISFYKNCRVEDGMSPDSIKICLPSNCWGKIFQTWDRSYKLNYNCNEWGTFGCKGCPQPKGTLHSGNTLCLFDNDGDGDMDMLTGNVSFSDMQFLQNGKENFSYPIDTMIMQDTTWQKNGKKLYLPQMPAAFWIDIDADGDNDLLISPKAENTSENYKNIHFYKNTGSVSAPNYTYQSDTFLVSQTIDLGTASRPVLYDYNKDGKEDIIVGSDGYFQPGGTLRSRLSYYRNTSTPGNPSFTLETTDFLGLSSLNIEGASCTIGDIDNDGKDDLLIGLNSGKIMYFKNNAASAAVQPNWQLTQQALLDESSNAVDVGGFAAPFIYDIDKDNKNDLIIGYTSGYLYYYQNVGGTNQLQLKYITNKLGEARASLVTAFDGISVPYIGKMDNTGKEYLLMGSASGRLYRYENLVPGQNFTRVDSQYSLTPIYYTNVRTAPAIADIDDDGRYEMLLGNALGGVYFYKQLFDVSVDGVVKEMRNEIKLYPNPAKENVTIQFADKSLSGKEVQVSVFNTLGQTVYSRSAAVAGDKITVDINNLPAGIFYFMIKHGQQVYSRQLSVVK